MHMTSESRELYLGCRLSDEVLSAMRNEKNYFICFQKQNATM